MKTRTARRTSRPSLHGEDRGESPGALLPDGGAVGGLTLQPFPGLRFDPGRAGDLTNVLAPALDTLTRDEALRHREAGAFSILKLVIPGAADSDSLTHSLQASARLRQWQLNGVLRRESAPALYVYEQQDAQGTQRGLIGALRLPRDPRAVLSHEHVDPKVSAQRLSWMRVLGAQIDPVQLTYDGGGAASRLLEDAAAAEPVMAVRTMDGTEHRLWPITSAQQIETINVDLAGRQAMIADGHHRWLAYHLLHHSLFPGSEAGLALLVDRTQFPLRVRAVHRVLPGLASVSAAAGLALAARVTPIPAGSGDPEHVLNAAFTALERSTAHGAAFVLTDGVNTYLVTDPPTALQQQADRPPYAPGTGSAIADLLLAQLWPTRTHGSGLGYSHDPLHALTEARRTGGTAVLLRPTAATAIRHWADQGLLMPRKSTSFGPKPALGLVLRMLNRI